MKFFATKLLRYVGKNESGDWENSTLINGNITDIVYADNQFFLLKIDGKTYCTNDFINFDTCGYISLSNSEQIHELVVGNNKKGFALTNSRTATYNGKLLGSYLSYSKLSFDDEYDNVQIGTISNFSTSSSWSNCHIRSIIQNGDNFIAFGFKNKSTTNVGIYSKYSSSFSAPVEISSMTAITNAQYIDELDKYILFGTDGYIATNTDDTLTSWDVTQVGDGTYEWDFAAYGNGKLVLCSANNRFVKSEDFGETWSNITTILSDEYRVRDLIYVQNKFYLLLQRTYFENSTQHHSLYCALSTDGLTYYPVTKIFDNNGGAFAKFATNYEKLVINDYNKIVYKDFENQ